MNRVGLEQADRARARKRDVLFHRSHVPQPVRALDAGEELDAAGKLQKMLFRGESVTAERKFKIAFNAYDAQGAGRRLPRLAEIVAAPQAKRRITMLDSRGALVDYLLERAVIE